MALQRLGPFELLRVLGRGGMGTVYEAREPGSQVHVAVKALAPQFSFDERFRHRFEGEIDALMKLEHDNIVRLLSYGQDEGNLFFAMELVDGYSLYQEQKKGQVFHWREIIDIAKQVCAGLRHAHDRGIIHRDLKPGNLMIDRNRRVKITDFGIAKSFGSSSLTREGNVLGTMDFMAPEQARGDTVTARSDLFSLGAVLYALLAGRPPFLQETAELTFEMLLSNRPPVQLNRIATDTPLPLAGLIHRLLEKDPSRRIATAMATARQLVHVENDIQSSQDETQVVDAAASAPNPDSVTRVIAGGAQPVGVRPTANDETRAGNDDDDGLDLGVKSPDYFNEVTPQQRLKSVNSVSGDTVSSPWPVVIALLLVVGLAAYGLWYTVIRGPSAEELLAAIRASERTPQRVTTELQQFMARFPEHQESGYVRDQLALAEAIQFRNTLMLRQRSVNPDLSVMENQFLSITGLSLNESPQALERMKGFLAVYSRSTELTESEKRAVAAAQVYLQRFQRDAGEIIGQNVKHIQDLLSRAGASADRTEALTGYQYIIDTYENDDWAEFYVQEARDQIQKLQADQKSP